MVDSHRASLGAIPGEAYAVLAAILFGSAYVATAVALEDFSAASAAAWRGLASTALLGVVVGASNFAPISIAAVRPGGYLRLLVIVMLGGPAFLLGMNYAVTWTGAATSAFVAGLYAVFAAALAPAFLKEPLDRRTVLGLVTGLIGATLLAHAPADNPAAGVAVAIGAALAFACYLVLSRRWADRYGLSGSLIAGGNFALSGIVLLGFTLAAGAGPLVPEQITATSLGAMAWLAVSSVVGQLAIMAAVRRVAQRSTSAMLLLNPPTAAILAWLLLGETFPPLKIGACILVLVGMVVVLLAQSEPVR